MLKPICSATVALRSGATHPGSMLSSTGVGTTCLHASLCFLITVDSSENAKSAAGVVAFAKLRSIIAMSRSGILSRADAVPVPIYVRVSGKIPRQKRQNKHIKTVKAMDESNGSDETVVVRAFVRLVGSHMILLIRCEGGEANIYTLPGNHLS